jgi:DNA-nicking Smr family endonuclease
MSKRGKPSLPDWHLWDDVMGSVTPLRRHVLRQSVSEAPLPLPHPAPRPKVRKLLPPMPSYQSDGRPGKAPRAGIEPGIKQRLQRGRIDIDGTIDLHGMRQVEAHSALRRFVHARSSRGDRTILVITGKGLKKLGDDAAVIIERGVLRAMLPIWLSEPELSPLVAGWDSAAQGHGGEGAFYVRLRRTREVR